jgi:hexosaminidase
MKKIFLLFSITLQLNVIAQNPVNVTPEPSMTNIKQGEFILTNETTIINDSKTENSKKYLTDYLLKFHKISLSTSDKNNNIIQLQFDATDKINGHYELSVTDKKITIKGNEEGIFNGIQTLIQLIPINKKTLKIQALEINDEPRFSYRGMHLDVGRHFFSVDFVKKYIDFLALHKFNTLHWHLTEDQGWRIEIKKYPLLTQTGSCRNQTLIGPYGTGQYDEKKYCGYYTQDQIKDIVKYATARYINIIPEIEMPGHSMAALTSYPYLGLSLIHI